MTVDLTKEVVSAAELVFVYGKASFKVKEKGDDTKDANNCTKENTCQHIAEGSFTILISYKQK